MNERAATTPATLTVAVAGPPVLETIGLSKTFPGQRVLSDVNWTVGHNEIHALLGQNGSGKSTLIKVLAGVHAPDGGSRILVDGAPLAPASPRESHRLGLRFVHQTLGVIDELTAVENVALGFGYRRAAGSRIDWRSQREKTRRLLERLEASFDIDQRVGALRPVDRTAVAIARALDDDEGTPRLLVLDEPTAALPPSEVNALFALIRQARAAGTSIVYVSHRLDEVVQLADHASVLRDGVLRGSGRIDQLGRSGLVELITGESEPFSGVHPPGFVGAAADDSARVALEVRALTGARLDRVDFDVAAGEVVGFAGLTGSGREELATALVGASLSMVELRDDSGRTLVNPDPRRARELGVILVLPNRAPGAAANDLTVRENLVLPSQKRYTRWGLISKDRERIDTLRWLEQLDIRPKSPEHLYALLSGGNQQKVIFGKWMNVDPRVMVLDDPTCGVDIQARYVIYEFIRGIAKGGKSVVVCSSDVDDLVAVCDRVIVLRDGRCGSEFRVPDLTADRLTREMLV